MTKQNHNWKCKECGRTIPTIMGGGCPEYQKEEFNLSDLMSDNKEALIYAKDVREAVRRLKETIIAEPEKDIFSEGVKFMWRRIDKIFGSLADGK